MANSSIPKRRAIIDRREIAAKLHALEAEGTAALRQAAVTELRTAMDAGCAEIAARLEAKPSRGSIIARSYSFLYDQLLRLIYDFTVQRLYSNSNPSDAERLTLIAVGGYGRSELAPFSDLDIGFLTPYKQPPWCEQVIESILYTLWDLGLKVGHSSRSLDDMVRMAKSDMTIRTALLEARYLWGDEDIYDEATRRFYAEVVEGTAQAFTAEKLAERDRRHERMGDSRYVVEPNVKDGKGGLRDLHTLFWIGRYVHKVRDLGELVEHGLLTSDELKQFRKARDFLLAVRCHLHLIANRPEERLTFDVQREIAERMSYAERTGKSAVERFMQHYFLIAKQVGDLTGVFLAHLDEQYGPRGRRFVMPTLRRKPRKLNGFTLDRGRLSIPDDGFFAEDPVRLIELFALADEHGLEIHPVAMRQAARDEKLVAKIRKNKRANALFLDVLTSPRDPEIVLRWMNEAGVFGRFIPDFGRVVAQMQFDMYHHYTVDEHTIRAIGLLAKIENGRLKDDHPLSHEVMGKLVSRRVLYVAVLLHDIAKGRGGDHSILGAEVAEKLCPRLGLDAGETQTVAWLVRWHLLMSATAFKRDLADPKTIEDFVLAVKSPERLKLLLVLTVVDIRAVGPGVWNDWKRQLLTDLYELAEETLRLGHKHHGRRTRIAEAQDALAAALDWPEADTERLFKRMPKAYWIAENVDTAAANARQMAEAEAQDEKLSIVTQPDSDRGATMVTVYTADHPGLFYRLAGAVDMAGANVIDARIYTTRDGMALDNILVQDPLGGTFADARQLQRLETAIRDALANKHKMRERLEARPLARTRAEAFHIQPLVLIDNKASNRYTVIEVNALDRPALLNSLTHALFQSRVTIRSAHIATYGERAVDTFYVTDLFGEKILNGPRLKALQKRLLEAAAVPDIKEEEAA
ncbi:MAG: [protein-PII] uridylyltransferase [Parasphingopyxis sp.]|uniref:[protein-PII] uridylyltransferase n=1 Tax=Parasphingopyxis sp. TaxID=1920299 RepID=UPI003FA0A6B6